MTEKIWRTVSRKDARLAGSALSMANGFVDSRLDGSKEGGIQGQRDALMGNYGDAFDAVANTMTKGGEDVRGLWRLVRKVRSLREYP